MRINPHHSLGKLLLIGAVTFTLLAQQTAPPPIPNTAPTGPQGGSQTGPAASGAKITVNTNLVVEDVTVTGKDGKPISGLTAKDFTVTEDGVAQEIKFCEFQNVQDEADVTPVSAKPAENNTPSSTARAKVDSAVAMEIKPEPPGDLHYKDRRLIVLYFDMGAMPVQDQLRAQTAAVKFVATQMHKADLVALISFSDGVHVLQDFTDDRDALLTKINKLFIGEADGFGTTDSDDSSADTGTAFGEDDTEFNIFNIDRQLAALTNTVKMLGALNEKKVLVYFSSGIRLQGLDNQAQFAATTNAAIKSNVAFWTVDARGLVAMSPLGNAGAGSNGGQGMYSGTSSSAMMSNFSKSQDTMYSLATDTGGKALLDNNDLSQGIVNAEQSISSYYVLGYYSSNTNLDGKFRKIKITYNGDPTAKITYRAGYLAGKVFAKFTAADKERQLMDALQLADPVTDLTIRMEIDYFQMNGAEYCVPIAVKIPGSELVLAKKRGMDHAVIDFIGEIKDEYGATVTNVRDFLDKKLTDETAQQLAKQPIQYSTVLTLLPGTYTIKFLARDDATGSMGTYMSKFVVPNLMKEQKKVPISSVVLSSQRIAKTDALSNLNKEKSNNPNTNPLIQDGQMLVPSVTRVFSKSREMYVYLQAYQPTATTASPLVAYVSFYRGNNKAFETPPMPVTEAMANKLKTMPMGFLVPLAKLPTGQYNCQVTVLDPAGAKASYWQAPVMVVP